MTDPVPAAATTLARPAPGRRREAPATQGGPGRFARPGRGACAGVAVAVLVYLTTTATPVGGPFSMVLLAALLVLVPVAATLARRVAVNAAILAGWLPLLWWVRWPVAVNHAALVLALATGVLAGVVLSAGSPRAALRRLVPLTAPVDLLLPIGGVLAAATMTNWLFAGSPRGALLALLPGADNYPHFNMFAAIRTYGATLDVLGTAGDGSRWGFYGYPQGFHALAASISELMHPGLGSGPSMLVAYTEAVGVIVVLAVVMTTAAIVSLPGLRGRPGVAVPVLVVTWAAYLWEPGQKALVDGFANFWLGAAAAGVALLLALSVPRFLHAPDLLAVGGLLVVCAHTWTPLLLFAAPAALVVLVRDAEARRHRPARRTVAVAAAVALATALAVLAAVVLLLRTVPIGYVVTTQTGGLHATSPLPTFTLLLVALYSCLRYGRLPVVGDGAVRGFVEPGRMRALALAPLSGLLVLGAFLVAQLQLIGTTAYYFLKYFIGFELVMAVLAPAACGLLVVALVPPVGRRAGVAVSLAAALLATQSFGWFPTETLPIFSRTGEGTAGLGGQLSPAGVADGILAASRGTRASETLTIEYFPLGGARALNPFYADAWFHAVQHSLSERVFERYGSWRVESVGLDSAARLIRPVLQREPDVRVVVDPRYVAPLRERLGAPGLAGRVVGWSPDGG